MPIKKRAVSVRRIPCQISSDSQMELIRDLQRAAENGDSRFVLDCSDIKNMDLTAARLLLSCLEEVMKHNGDVRLAMLHPEAHAAMHEMGIGRLFESYQTMESALHSYQARSYSLAPLSVNEAYLDQDTEYAA